MLASSLSFFFSPFSTPLSPSSLSSKNLRTMSVIATHFWDLSRTLVWKSRIGGSRSKDERELLGEGSWSFGVNWVEMRSRFSERESIEDGGNRRNFMGIKGSHTTWWEIGSESTQNIERKRIKTMQEFNVVRSINIDLHPWPKRVNLHYGIFAQRKLQTFPRYNPPYKLGIYNWHTIPKLR